MASYSPNIFGSNASMQAWLRITEIIDYKGDSVTISGTRPDLDYVSKSKLRKNKRKMIDDMEATKAVIRNYADQLVQGKYLPEGILIIGFLLISKGVFMSTELRDMILSAIQIERDKASSLKGYNKSQRNKQLNHFQNVLEEYQNGSPLTVKLYHSKSGTKRAKETDKKRRKNRRAGTVTDKKMSDADTRFFAETFMIMRIIHGVKIATEKFKIFAPRIPTPKLIQYLQNDGQADEKGRPTKWFKSEMIGKLRDFKNA